MGDLICGRSYWWEILLVEKNIGGKEHWWKRTLVEKNIGGKFPWWKTPIFENIFSHLLATKSNFFRKNLFDQKVVTKYLFPLVENSLF